MPAFVPKCSICRVEAQALGEAEGFRHHAFAYLCAACVSRVKSAGPWKERRARAVEARTTALLERFDLYIAETAAKRVTLRGAHAGRPIWITLRVAPRGDTYERYIFRVALQAAIETVDKRMLHLDDALAARISTGPTVARDEHRWLRVGFLHLGKLDTVHVLEALLSTAAALDDKGPTDDG